ncbi:MAG: DUF790 family protein [Candidatus Bathyarchaeota archaeon]|uniref:DUF790 family protein n=1 Tax=Candidatus Bathycorpusculum sp. TaxID=2994959 RepID=UPI00281D5A27|nr:DUF790 family protein [Candidatus Termiticorpusculum sp.]MCL2257254.1 DUF790 family protein [Candidatus Termiticorpusculum sp.]MCL2292623.1 DUF790 family protein [Candidatus Termiticorpusculum sp.]
MLPSNLLLVYKHKGEIQPKYVRFSSENLQFAQRLINLYQENVGAKKKVLLALTSELENQGHNYRFVRALTLLLDRKSLFVCNSKIEPYTLRKKIFQVTKKYGIPTNFEARRQILESAALDVELTIETIEEQLYADLDAELFFEKFTAPSALELLAQYNLCLAQTLLFECSELTFKVSGNWQKLFFFVKKLGLIYNVSQDETNNFCVTITGPSTLFKLTKRYGVNIAKLLPAIVANQTWTIHAKILWKYTNEIYTLNMDNTKQGPLLNIPNPNNSAADNLLPTSFDSAAEESFASQFKALCPDWLLKREPEPVLAGNQVLVPDFSLEKSGLKIYLEIIGFWTDEYLRRKAEKLKHVNVQMILIVREALACEKLFSLEKRPQLHFIYYKDKLPMAPLLCYLQTAFEKVKEKETRLLREMSIKFTESVLFFAEFAKRVGVSVDAVVEVLTKNPPTGYVLLSNGLISEGKLEQVSQILRDTLNQLGKMTFNQAAVLLEAEGISDATTLLAKLGYKIKWHGISSEQAEIIPPTKFGDFE